MGTHSEGRIRSMAKHLLAIGFTVVVLVLGGCAKKAEPTPTPKPIPTYTRYPTYAPQATPEPLPTYTSYPQPEPLPTYTPYSEPEPLATYTLYPTYTAYPSPTAPPTATPKPTRYEAGTLTFDVYQAQVRAGVRLRLVKLSLAPVQTALKDAEIGPLIEFSVQDAGTTGIGILDIEIKNDSDQPVNVFPYTGLIFMETEEYLVAPPFVISSDSLDLAGEIMPGETVAGFIVFDLGSLKPDEITLLRYSLYPPVDEDYAFLSSTTTAV